MKKETKNVAAGNETSMEANAKEDGAQNLLPVIRNYKDTVFRMIYRENEELLNLYNAVNHTHYDNPTKN